MRVPYKLIIPAVLISGVCGGLIAANASADEAPISVSAETYCAADGTVAITAHVTNISDQSLGLLITDVIGGTEHRRLDFAAGDSASFEFPTASQLLADGALTVNVGVGENVSDYQALDAPYLGLDCQPPPPPEPEVTLPPETTTSTTELATTTTETTTTLELVPLEPVDAPLLETPTSSSTTTTSTTELATTTTEAPTTTTTSPAPPTTQPAPIISATSIVADPTPISPPPATAPALPIGQLAFTG